MGIFSSFRGVKKNKEGGELILRNRSHLHSGCCTSEESGSSAELKGFGGSLWWRNVKEEKEGDKYFKGKGIFFYSRTQRMGRWGYKLVYCWGCADRSAEIEVGGHSSAPTKEVGEVRR